MSLHPTQSEIPRFCLQFLLIRGPKKIRSPNSSARNPLTRDLSGLGFVELQNGHVFSPHAGKGQNSSKNVQVSCPLLERRGGHVVVFQVKVPQISFIRNLFMMLRRALHHLDFCSKSRLLLIAHASFLTHPVPMAQMGLVRLEVFFFFVIVQELCVLRQIHAFLSVVLFLMKVVSEVCHLHLQNR